MTESRRRWVVVAMCAVVGIVLFDESGVAIALTAIRSDFELSRTSVNWVLTTYLVSLSATVAGFGRLADLVGLKTLVTAGSVAFGVASIAAGLAPDPAWLLVARGVQGLGAAAAFPAAAGIVRSITPPDRLGRALGFFGLSSAIGLMAGPLLGGWLIETTSWRSIFYLSVPVVLFIVLVTSRALGEIERDETAGARFDWGGVLLLIVALGALVCALMQGPVWGWISVPSLSLFAVGTLAAGLFVRVERGRTDPVIEVALFSDPTFFAANATTFFAQFAKTSVIVYGPYYMIEVLGMSPLEAGNGLVPGILVVMFAAPWSGALVDRVGARKPVLSAMAALTLSLFYVSFAVGRDSYSLLVPGLLVWGFGAATMFAGSRRAVQDAVPATKSGQASGINSTAQWLGAAVSVPIFGAFVHTAPHFGRLYLAAAGFLAVATVVVWWRFQDPRRESEPPGPGQGRGPVGSTSLPARRRAPGAKTAPPGRRGRTSRA